MVTVIDSRTEGLGGFPEQACLTQASILPRLVKWAAVMKQCVTAFEDNQCKQHVWEVYGPITLLDAMFYMTYRVLCKCWATNVVVQLKNTATSRWWAWPDQHKINKLAKLVSSTVYSQSPKGQLSKSTNLLLPLHYLQCYLIHMSILLYGIYVGSLILFLLGHFCHLCLSYYVFFSKLVLAFILWF